MIRRASLVGMALFATLLAGESGAQSSVDAAIAASNTHLADGSFDKARREVFQSLRRNPSVADRDRLVAQLDRINANVPYFFSLGFHSEFTTGTRQDLWDHRLNWKGVPHYTDDTLSVVASEASLRNTFDLGFGYTWELTPDVALIGGADASIYYFDETNFMQAWVLEPYIELDVSLGPLLANTHLGYGFSSKSRDKVDFNPNFPRVTGAYHMSAEQDVGFKFAKDQIVGTEITVHLGDATDNVQEPGTRYEHLTLETYYDAGWGGSLDTRLFGYAQVSSTDPAYPGFQAFGGGVEMDLGLPLGFGLVGDLQYRMQSGFEPYPDRSEDLDVTSVSGGVELSNSHYSLRGFKPFLNAAFEDSSATYDEYTESNIDIGAGLRFSF